MTDLQTAHQESQTAWNANAAYWDQYMGEGNHFVEVLIWPATQRLLTLQPDERVLDIACGNGLYARKLAALGAQVTAFDFAPAMIAHAQARTTKHADRIDYHVIDATDEAALLALGEGQFDAAICQMALMDMAEVEPLFRAVTRLLKSDGRFLFSIQHPAFNNPNSSLMGEFIPRDGKMVTEYSAKVSGYLTTVAEAGEAIRGQPELQVYFHRSLQTLLGMAFQAGFVLDGLEEPAFPPEFPSRNPLSWGGDYSEIPPVFMARLRAAR